MYNPTTRLLTILELLQGRDKISGPELAQRLEVDIRSVRRYMMMLQDLGIPVEASRGRYGTYKLGPGYKLPPLMLGEEEALAVMLGLLTIQNKGLLATTNVEVARAKVARVLPVKLRARLQILQQVVQLMPDVSYIATVTSGEVILKISEAIYERQQVWLTYRSERDHETERLLDPYGMAYWGGRWYVVGYCHLRHDLRAFRLDRVLQSAVRASRFEAPADFDCSEYLFRSLGADLPAWEVEVIFDANLASGQQKILETYGSLERHPDGWLHRYRTNDLADTARLLINLRCRFVVIKPVELKTALHELAREIEAIAESSSL